MFSGWGGLSYNEGVCDVEMRSLRLLEEDNVVVERKETQCGGSVSADLHPARCLTPKESDYWGDLNVSLAKIMKILADVGAIGLGWPAAKYLNGLIWDA